MSLALRSNLGGASPCTALRALVAIMLLVSPVSVRAAQLFPNALRLGTSVDFGEVMNVGGTQPTAQLLSTVGIDAGWHALKATTVFAEGAVGGFAFDFSGLGFAGRIHDQVWRVAVGVRQNLVNSRPLGLYLRLGGAYAEVSSWVENGAGRYTGPGNHVASAFMGLGTSAGVSTSLSIFGELTQSGGYASASDPTLHAHYSWFYGGLRTAIGLEWSRSAKPN